MPRDHRGRPSQPPRLTADSGKFCTVDRSLGTRRLQLRHEFLFDSVPSKCENSTARSGRFWPNQCTLIPLRTHTDSPSTPLPASTTQPHCETAIPTKMRPARLPHAKRTALRSSQHRHLYTVGSHHYEAGLQHLRSAITLTSPLLCC